MDGTQEQMEKGRKLAEGGNTGRKKKKREIG